MFKSFPSTNFPSKELVLFSHTQGHVITFAIMSAFSVKKLGIIFYNCVGIKINIA